MLTTKNRRILIVDDNTSIQNDFRKILCGSLSDKPLSQNESELFPSSSDHASSSLFFEVDFALQGEDGFRLVKEAMESGRPYAMAFIDVRMPPGWDGVETIRNIWQIQSDLQVVICTAYSDYSLSEILQKLGSSDRLLILKKPYENIEVVQLANALTEKWNLSRQAQLREGDLTRMVDEKTSDLQQEIAEHSRVEDQLRHSEELYRSLIETSPDSILLAGLDGVLIKANQQAIHLHGYTTSDEMAGFNVFERVFLPDKVASISIVDELLSQGIIRKELLGLRKDGSRFPLELSASVISGPDGKPALIIGVWRDISTRKQMEEEILQKKKLESVGQLAAGVAHHFNNIMAVIQGHAALLMLDPVSDPAVADSLGAIVTAADRASKLTRQLLMFSRRQLMVALPLNLNDVIIELTKRLKQLAGHKITMELNLSPKLPDIMADLGMMDQVVSNVFKNGCDSMPQGGNISVNTSIEEIDSSYTEFNPEARKGRFVCLNVTDTGCGMDEATANRLFEPFFTTKEVGQGTGLGLATVYGIVKQHQGWIKVVSSPGKGTSVRLYFPASDNSVRVM
jgi:PAS domain S-box-containing protein